MTHTRFLPWAAHGDPVPPFDMAQTRRAARGGEDDAERKKMKSQRGHKKKVDRTGSKTRFDF